MSWLCHYGVAHDENPPGRGSGRYAYGSGKEPYQKRSIRKRIADYTKREYLKKEKEREEREKIANKASLMTDKELQDVVNRMRLERSYYSLLNETSSERSRYIDKFNKIIVDDIIVSSLVDIGRQVVRYSLGTTINSKTGRRIINIKNDKPLRESDDQ